MVAWGQEMSSLVTVTCSSWNAIMMTVSLCASDAPCIKWHLSHTALWDPWTPCRLLCDVVLQAVRAGPPRAWALAPYYAFSGKRPSPFLVIAWPMCWLPWMPCGYSLSPIHIQSKPKIPQAGSSFYLILTVTKIATVIPTSTCQPLDVCHCVVKWTNGAYLQTQ